LEQVFLQPPPAFLLAVAVVSDLFPRWLSSKRPVDWIHFPDSLCGPGTSIEETMHSHDDFSLVRRGAGVRSALIPSPPKQVVRPQEGTTSILSQTQQTGLLFCCSFPPFLLPLTEPRGLLTSSYVDSLSSVPFAGFTVFLALY